MMKKLLIIFLLACSGPLMAGGGYKLYHTQDGIEVYGKWKYEKPGKKGKMMLCVKVVNTTASAMSVNFDINFYDVAVLSETSSVDSLCVPGGKARKGGKYGLCVVSQEFSNEKMLEESFHWKVEEMVAVKTEECGK